MAKSKGCKVPNKATKKENHATCNKSGKARKRGTSLLTTDEIEQRLCDKANASSLRFVTDLMDSLLALPYTTKAQRQRMEQRLYKSFVIAQVDACKASHLSFINKLTSK